MNKSRRLSPHYDQRSLGLLLLGVYCVLVSAYLVLVSHPVCVRLLVRNGLVNKSRISWAYSPKVVRANEIVRLVGTSLITVIFTISTRVSNFFEQFGVKCFDHC